MAHIAYVRVSTEEQNEARQIEALEKRGIGKWFTEKISAKDMNRPQLNAMLDYVREGDTVYIHDFSRLARSTKDLLEIVEFLQKKQVHLVSNKENLDTSTPTGKLMLTMIAAINEFERQNLLDRQREGVAIAKREGKYKGRQVKQIDDATFSAQYARYTRWEINKRQLAEALSISRPTLDLSLIHISEPTRRTPISYAVFCLKKKKADYDYKKIPSTSMLSNAVFRLQNKTL